MERALFKRLADKPGSAIPSCRISLTLASLAWARDSWRCGSSCMARLNASPGRRSIEGRATVVDGDTLAIEGLKARIRLYGIDAPESSQTCDDASGKRYLCGGRAAQYLADLIGRSGRVTCFEEDRDRYGRIVAECATPDNKVAERRDGEGRLGHRVQAVFGWSL